MISKACAGLVLILCVVIAARAVPPCCAEAFSWDSNPVCSGASTTYCEEASDNVNVGLNFDAYPTTAVCFKVVPNSGGYFVQATCGSAPPGCNGPYGPPFSGNKCCYVFGTATITQVSRGFGIWRCGKNACGE